MPVSRPLHLFNTSNKNACWWSWKQGYIYQQVFVVHILGGRDKRCCSTAWIRPANWLQSQYLQPSHGTSLVPRLSLYAWWKAGRGLRTLPWYSSAADEAWYWPECVQHKMWLFDCSCSIALTKFKLTWHNYIQLHKQLAKVSCCRQGIGVHVYHVSTPVLASSTCNIYVRCTGCIVSHSFLLWSRRWRYQSLLHPLSCGGYSSLCHSQEQHTRSQR